MLNNEEPRQQDIGKSNRHRAIFRPQHRVIDVSKAVLKEQASRWVHAHPWSVMAGVLGAAGLLGYSLGLRT